MTDSDDKTLIACDRELDRVTGANYEIVIRGRPSGSLTRWPDELEVSSSDPDTTELHGWFPDQAALQGLLRRVAELGLELSSIRRLPDAD